MIGDPNNFPISWLDLANLELSNFFEGFVCVVCQGEAVGWAWTAETSRTQFPYSIINYPEVSSFFVV